MLYSYPSRKSGCNKPLVDNILAGAFCKFKAIRNGSSSLIIQSIGFSKRTYCAIYTTHSSTIFHVITPPFAPQGISHFSSEHMHKMPQSTYNVRKSVDFRKRQTGGLERQPGERPVGEASNILAGQSRAFKKCTRVYRFGKRAKEGAIVKERTPFGFSRNSYK